jgi:hypothetical protein
VTQGTGTPIAGAVSPHLHSGLANGTPYYYVVTALDTGESADSAPASATPAAGTTSLPLPGPVSGTAFPTGPDPFEGLPNDNASSGARAILVGDPPQARTLFPAGDEDWMRVDLAASTTYEFSANNLSIRGDTQLELYDAVPSLIFSNDDWVGLDSRVAYTTGPTPETVFLRVLLSPFAIPPDDLPVMTYSISARVFTDGDTDGYSPFYDCDDTKGAHYPYAPETAGDGIDQDCDQTDDLLPTTVDGVDSVFPGDDTVADAPSFSLASGSIYELQLRPETFVLNAHTLHLSTDVDYMWVNVSGYSQIDVSTLYDAVPNGLWLDWFAADGVTPLGSNSGALPALTLNNPNPGVTTFYLRFMAFDGSSTGYYVFAAEDLGVDVDGDGYYTRGGGLGWDCDDVKPGIYPGAPGEAAADGEDTNCNGLDDS